LPSVDLNNYPPARPGTAGSNRPFGPPQPYRNPSESSSRYNGPYTASPASYSTATMPTLPNLARTDTMNTSNSYPRPPPPPGAYNGGRSTPTGPRSGFSDQYPGRSASPAPSGYSARTAQSGPMSPAGHPSRSATGPLPPRGPPGQYPPQRNLTAPMAPRQATADSGGSDYFSRPPTSGSGGGYGPPSRAGTMQDADYYNRPGTAQSQRGMPQQPRAPYGAAAAAGGGRSDGSGWGGDVEAQRSGTPSRFSE
jgi:hypothetical protein